MLGVLRSVVASQYQDSNLNQGSVEQGDWRRRSRLDWRKRKTEILFTGLRVNKSIHSQKYPQSLLTVRIKTKLIDQFFSELDLA